MFWGPGIHAVHRRGLHRETLVDNVSMNVLQLVPTLISSCFKQSSRYLSSSWLSCCWNPLKRGALYSVAHTHNLLSIFIWHTNARGNTLHHHNSAERHQRTQRWLIMLLLQFYTCNNNVLEITMQLTQSHFRCFCKMYSFLWKLWLQRQWRQIIVQRKTSSLPRQIATHTHTHIRNTVKFSSLYSVPL